MVPLYKCKAKAIETDLCTFRHNQAYPEIYSVILIIPIDIFK